MPGTLPMSSSPRNVDAGGWYLRVRKGVRERVRTRLLLELLRVRRMLLLSCRSPSNVALILIYSRCYFLNLS